MENINSGSADMDEEVQQVNHYLDALEKEVEIKTPPPKNQENRRVSIGAHRCLCPR